MSQAQPSAQDDLGMIHPSLTTLKLGPLPVIRHFLDRLNVREIVDVAAPKPGAEVSNGECIEALVMAVFLDQQHALSRVSEVLSGYDMEKIFRPGVKAAHFHDTRLGEALDDLYEKAPTIYGDIVGKAIRVFKLDVRRLNMDITKILLHGEYNCYEDYVEHLKTVVFPEHGWNPEGRWDLKQLLLNLIVTEDKIPLLYSFGDGKASETNEYLTMMRRLDTIQADLNKAVLNIDSKGCAAKTMIEAVKQKLRLVTLVPETFGIQKGLIEYVSQMEMELLHTTESGDQYYGKSIKRPILIDFETKEEVKINGMCRYLVVFSTDKAERAKETRKREIREERERLEREITSFTAKKLFACQADALQAASDAARAMKPEYHSISWKTMEGAVQRGRGRPSGKGLKTNDKTGWVATFALEEIPRPVYRFDPDGMFVLLTTVEDKRILSDTDVLLGYKGRNVVEISFNWLKSDAAVAPMFLKKVSRIQTMGFVFVLWMLIYGVIQRELRQALKKLGGKCPHPDKRWVDNPTTRGVLDLFNHVCLTSCRFGEKNVEKIQLWNPVLDRVLELLDAPALYAQYSRSAYV